MDDIAKATETAWQFGVKTTVKRSTVIAIT
jgi:hypothetical protein